MAKIRWFFRIFGIFFFLEFLEFPVFGIFYKLSDDFQVFSFLFLQVFTDFSRCYSFPLKIMFLTKWENGQKDGRLAEKSKMVLRKNVSEKMFRKNFFSFSRLSLYGWEKWIKWYGDIVECYVTFSNFMKFHRSSWMIYRTLSAPNELRVEPPPRIIFTNIEIRNLRDDFWKKSQEIIERTNG